MYTTKQNRSVIHSTILNSSINLLCLTHRYPYHRYPYPIIRVHRPIIGSFIHCLRTVFIAATILSPTCHCCGRARQTLPWTFLEKLHTRLDWIERWIRRDCAGCSWSSVKSIMNTLCPLSLFFAFSVLTAAPHRKAGTPSSLHCIIHRAVLMTSSALGGTILPSGPGARNTAAVPIIIADIMENKYRPCRRRRVLGWGHGEGEWKRLGGMQRRNHADFAIARMFVSLRLHRLFLIIMVWRIAGLVGPLGSLSFSLPMIVRALAEMEGSSIYATLGGLGCADVPTSPSLGSAPCPTEHEVPQNFKSLLNPKTAPRVPGPRR